MGLGIDPLDGLSTRLSFQPCGDSSDVRAPGAQEPKVLQLMVRKCRLLKKSWLVEAF